MAIKFVDSLPKKEAKVSKSAVLDNFSTGIDCNLIKKEAVAENLGSGDDVLDVSCLKIRQEYLNEIVTNTASMWLHKK